MNRRELMTTAFAAVIVPNIPPAIAEVAHAAEPVRDLPVTLCYSKDATWNELIIWQAENPTKKYYVTPKNVDLFGMESLKHLASFRLIDLEKVTGTFKSKQSVWDAFRNCNETRVVDDFGLQEINREIVRSIPLDKRV